MASGDYGSPAAVLMSGGLDSSVLAWELCRSYEPVTPFYVRAGLVWEEAELDHLARFLAAVRHPRLLPLKLFEQPVRDVYGDHWSVTGRAVPDRDSLDGAVFLPGRNLFLVTKAAVWCVLNGIGVLALGSLSLNPFPDSSPVFDAGLEGLVELSLGAPLRIIRPYADSSKVDIIRRGAGLPLELTISCISPVEGRHCGRCNKCEERRRAFREARVADPTVYARTG